MNKLIVIVIATAVVVGGGAFFGGMKYAESTRQNFSRRNLGGQELGANAGSFRGGAGSGQRGGGEFTAGEIIAKDDLEGEQAPYGASKSVTVKLQNGGSKIVFLSDSTEITKSVAGALSDLEVGNNITVNGTANSDGSVTAKSIQLRPQQ